MTRVIIVGSRGRMGRALVAVAEQMPEVSVAGEADQGDDLAAILPRGEVVIDFSFHTATLQVASRCADLGKPIVIGTTGHDEEERRRILALQSRIPMVWSSNFSTGVNTLFWLTEKAAEILGPGYDLEVIETHHRLKKDAPSGTATSLAEILARVRNLQMKEALRHGRHGITGERTSTEIGMHAVRGGDVVGDHTVLFATAGERLELTHRTTNRDNLARGALRAAAWVLGQPPGLYDMRHVLGLH